jgi:hypothetical protein
VNLRFFAGVVFTVVRHPRLWPVAVGQWRRLTPRGWWRRAPFLPVPAPEYVRFRLVTQYGGTQHAPSGQDVLHYLAWCRRQR